MTFNSLRRVRLDTSKGHFKSKLTLEPDTRHVYFSASIFSQHAEVPQLEAVHKFTLLPNLPIELRTVIWELAIPEERVIEIHVKKDSNSYFTDTNIPAALHTCRESRVQALEEYEVMGFGNEQACLESYKEDYLDELRERLRLKRLAASSKDSNLDVKTDHEVGDKSLAGFQGVKQKTDERSI